jgi:signal transduction histidine kinase/ABC-type amino acid transport substrate-binding protein/CheY-like chemotaxis protein
MRNFLIKLSCFFLIIISAQALYASDSQKKLTIKGDKAFPPYEFINKNGQPDGFDIDLIKAIMDRIGQPYSIELDSWNDAFKDFTDNKVDCLSGLVLSNQRTKNFFFSNNHSTINYVIVCRKKESRNYNVFKDLEGKDIIVARGSITEQIIRDAGYGEHFIYVPTMEDGMKMLSKGVGDVAVTSVLVASNNIKNDKLHSLTTVDIGIPPMNYCFAFNKDNGMVMKVNLALVSMKKDGSYKKLYDKWFPQERIKHEELIANAIGIVLLAMLILFFLFSRYLRKKIKTITRAANLQNQRYQTLYDNTMVGLEYYDKDGILKDLNKADCEIYGISDAKKIVDSHLSLFDHPNLKDKINRNDFKTFSGIIKYDFRKGIRPHYLDYSTKDEIIYVYLRLIPIIDYHGNLESVICTSVDLTEQYSLTLKLQESQERLEEAKAKAENADRLKSAFLANMSHEIRTPLNAIVGFSELMEGTDNAQERSNYMKIINQNNELLLNLIGDILDLSKIESGLFELKPETFDFSEVFEEVFSILNQRYVKPDVVFTKNNPYKKCILTLDKNRVKQICWNYLTNAVKYTKKGTIMMAYEYVDGGLKIDVKDTGIGIADDKKSRVFKRFEKFDDFAQGTGLGLSICKAIAESMGGKVGFESEFGKGSSFWAWLPCTAEISHEEQQVQAPINANSLSDLQSSSPKDKEYNILVAEDNDSNYLLVKAILKSHVLTRAVNGEKAVELASKNRYDAILMDIRMPIMDGLEATKKIREFDKNVKIIALTANAFDSDRVDAMNAGCDSFLTKPLNKKELMKVLEP